MRSGSARHLAHGRQGKWDTTGILLDDSVVRGRIDLAAIFGNARPVEVEIGAGKGTFLLARAQVRPELNFLGIERARAYCLYAADRIRRGGLANVRMVCVDAGHFLRICLADRSIWRLHIYFPDPWPKRRHHRRRLINAGFLADVRRVLRLGGQLAIVTDHLDYFQQICRVLAAATGLVDTPFPQTTATGPELVGTNFERKYIAQGRAFYRTAKMRCR